MSSGQQNSSIPVTVPSTAYLAYLRHVANHEAMDTHLGPPIAFALDDAADADRGFAALGDTEPAAHRLVVHDIRELGRCGLHMRMTNGRWGVVGLDGDELFDRDAAPALTIGSASQVSELVAPIVLEHSERIWIYAQLAEGNLPPALINLPVLSPAGHALLQFGLAVDAIEARDRISGQGLPGQAAKRDAYLDTAVRHLAQAADIVSGHPESVVSGLTAIARSHFQLSMRNTTGVGERLGRVLDPRRSSGLEGAIVAYEHENDVHEGWIVSSISMASLPFRSARAAEAPVLDRSTPRPSA